MLEVFFLSLPIYFFVVLFNILAGLILCSEYITEKIPVLTGLVEFLNNKEAKFIMGLGSLIAGFFKLFMPIGIIIIGDFIPAFASMGLGIALLTEFFKESTTINSATIEKLDNLVLKNRNMIGGFGIFISAIHLLFAGVPVLL
ncbi:MAG: hypothetical protein JXB88_02030 [Spirochaetales bacterium]|nr:hypothetical protein [Spirochaetales bacterium]